MKKILIFFIIILAIIILLAPKLTDTNKPQETSVIDQELKNKIGQMIIIGFRGTEAQENSDVHKIITDIKPGGVILFDYDVPSNSFPRNIVSYEQTKKLIADLKSYSSTPLFTAVDAEGGAVNRLKEKYGSLPIVSAEKMGKDLTLETTKEESEKLAEELSKLGFNMNFAPVVDLNINNKNPIIGGLERSFSSDPKIVINNAKVFIESHNKNNIVAVAKHFPGHGSSTGDSHLGLVDVTNTYQAKELDPYIELQKTHLLNAVMTAHIINKNIDKEYPATLSYNFIQKILRDQVGFDGVVISDDMQMNAIVNSFGTKEAIIKAINAGCDMLLLSNNGTAEYNKNLPYEAVDIIYNAVKEGIISEERIEESYKRIYELKRKFGII
jgi:beta-N-acetylhexosaminidase